MMKNGLLQYLLLIQQDILGFYKEIREYLLLYQKIHLFLYFFSLLTFSLRANSMKDILPLFPARRLAAFIGTISSASLCAWVLTMPTTLTLKRLLPAVRVTSSP